MIAEKIRALLQQAVRSRRGRRQDVYDIHFLLDRFGFGDEERADILNSLLKKCYPRLQPSPDIDSIDDTIIKEKAQAEWDDIRLETGTLPDFEACFGKVREFYRKLPWPTKVSSD
ncbi:MAG: nucleotidyl transferase AbiEii/AbiGii toxin family protein [Rhodobacteraceae bacterium]|nr:nucleotidyl transferase AbiEii/AbiGii toxin family protein [Paracoccaceae bacterium]